MATDASTSFYDERRALRAGALLHPRPDLAVFAVTGRERATWLNGIVTADVGSLARGTGAFGLAVGKTGKILADLWILPTENALLVVLARALLPVLQEHLRRYLIMEDAEVGEALPRAVLFAHGPLSREVVALAPSLGAEGAMVDWTGQGNAAVFVAEGSDAEGRGLLGTVVAHLASNGARATVASDAAWEALRVELGVPRMGVDFDGQNLPHEASLEQVAVSFTKGCYLGQEAIVMLERRGHAKKRLTRISVEGAEPLAAGAEIHVGNDLVGAVTSATRDPEGTGTLALGYVKYKHATAGVTVAVEGRAGRLLGLAAAPVVP
jgi:folate-binding protein YgfZ